MAPELRECRKCGAVKPLEVVWLCAKCHKLEHRHAPDAVAA